MFECETAHLAAAGITTPLTELAQRAETDTLARNICRTVSEVTRIERSLVDQGEQIKNSIDRVTGWVTDGTPRGINNMGELQSAGPRYDATCAELVTARRALAMLGELWTN